MPEERHNTLKKACTLSCICFLLVTLFLPSLSSFPSFVASFPSSLTSFLPFQMITLMNCYTNPYALLKSFDLEFF